VKIFLEKQGRNLCSLQLKAIVFFLILLVCSFVAGGLGFAIGSWRGAITPPVITIFLGVLFAIGGRIVSVIASSRDNVCRGPNFGSSRRPGPAPESYRIGHRVLVVLLPHSFSDSFLHGNVFNWVDLLWTTSCEAY